MLGLDVRRGVCPLCPSDISPASGGNPSTRAPITLTLALSRRGRGDTRVLPEGVFGVGGVVPHLACFVLPWVGVQSAEAPASVGMTVRFGWRRFFGVVVVRVYEPPASLRAASPFCFASLRKRGGFGSSHSGHPRLALLRKRGRIRRSL